jgi:hypothetical protein
MCSLPSTGFALAALVALGLAPPLAAQSSEEIAKF